MLDTEDNHSTANEKFVLKLRDQIIMNAIMSGRDIIVDDTNLHYSNERQIRKIVGNRANVEVIFFDISVEECIKRNATREGYARVPDQVIYRMAKDWEKWKHVDCSVPPETEFEQVVYDPSLPSCWIFDIDGTIARNIGRGFYDWHRVGEDEVIKETQDLLSLLQAGNLSQVDHQDAEYIRTIIFSGREYECYEQTALWLKEHGFQYDELHMRSEPGTTQPKNAKDSLVKDELYNLFIKGKYNVEFVVDDRKQVKEMWVAKGLFVLDVNQHDEWF